MRFARLLRTLRLPDDGPISMTGAQGDGTLPERGPPMAHLQVRALDSLRVVKMVSEPTQAARATSTSQLRAVLVLTILALRIRKTVEGIIKLFNAQCEPLLSVLLQLIQCQRRIIMSVLHWL
jgi:hypothetical protein